MERDCNGNYLTEIVSMDECKYLIDEVCCNDQSEQCCDFPHPEYCAKRCPHFTKEDGVINYT
ncbi:MAG: hypothetical protein ACI4PO_03755 [Faecousia sp.]